MKYKTDHINREVQVVRSNWRRLSIGACGFMLAGGLGLFISIPLACLGTGAKETAAITGDIGAFFLTDAWLKSRARKRYLDIEMSVPKPDAEYLELLKEFHMSKEEATSWVERMRGGEE